MIKLKHCRSTLFLLALAMVCAAGKVLAQEDVPEPNGQPVVIDRKQAAGLVLAQPAPEYPPVAKVNYIQGHVQLQLTVNGTGKVAKVHVVQGNALLAASALKAARRWTYRPLAIAGGTSGFITTVEMKFALHYEQIELTPLQAERDFLRQVKPPQVVRATEDAHQQEIVHMRLLVNDQGEVVDREVWPTGLAQLEAARETLQSWTFRPAHWGTLPIASYLDVDIPVSAPSMVRAAVK
ncbi:MAG: TonB family protein [Terriglobia bacterium]|jgi:TonB family protein